MDWLTFISNLIRDLAWPLVILTAFILVMKRGHLLAPFVKAIKFKDFEVTMRESIEAARVEVEKIQIENPQIPPLEDNSKDKILKLAEIDRGVAVVEIWKKLEIEIRKLMQHNGLVRFTNSADFVKHLGKIGELTGEEVRLFYKLRQIRNMSIHEVDGSSAITLGEVLEFNDFVNVLTQKFEQIKSEPGYIDMPDKPLRTPF